MRSDTVILVTLGVFAFCLVYVLGNFLYSFMRYRSDPAQREMVRRATLFRIGRVAEGTIYDLDDRSLYYQYNVNGVPYSTAQDISAIEICLPENRNMVIGEVWVKFDSNNPSNSIVVSEQWSGFRANVGRAKAASV